MTGPSPLAEVARWPVGVAAVAVVGVEGVVDATGPLDEVLPLASVTKVLSGMACWLAVEEGSLDLDESAGPPGSTVRHLLAHASGLAFDSDDVLAKPGRLRIYSNRGIERAAEHLVAGIGIPFADYLVDGILAPLGASATTLDGSPAHEARGTVADLARIAGELLAPDLLATETVAAATAVTFPGLDGVVPGFGRQSPNDWGLGVEIRDHKSPHWMAPEGSPRTFGHFGRAGGFIWVDPDAGLACCCLTDTDFGPWAVEAWPRLSSAVLRWMAG